MPLTAIFQADIAAGITLPGFMMILFATILCGLLFSSVYIFNHREEVAPSGLPLSMVVVPVAAAVVILLVGRNVATALGLGGIFVLVRFRSGPVETKDLAYLFSSICCGVLSGCGYVAYAILFTLVMCVLIFALEAAKWGQPEGDPMLLRIWVPETLDFQGTFEPVLEQYTKSYTLLMIRTTDFGSLCELRYKLLPKAGMDQKALLDDIRIRNGNMNVTLVVAPAIVERKDRQVL